VTWRHRLDIGATGERDVVLYDDSGNEMATVDVGEREVVFGPGPQFASLEFDPGSDQARLFLHDATGTVTGEFAVPADRRVQLGEGALLLRPRAPHSIYTNFELEFRDLDGRLLASQNRDNVALVDVRRDAGGSWVACAVSSGGDYEVFLFGPRGELRWRTVLRAASAAPAVGVSPTWDRAALGTMNEDLQTSRLLFLDASGNVIESRTVPHFRTALFSPDGSHLVLVGDGAVQLLDGRSGRALWRSTGNIFPATGETVVFTPDGSRFHVLSQEDKPSGGPERVFLRTYSRLGPNVNEQVRLVSEVPPSRSLSVVDLRALEDGRVAVTTPEGGWTLTP
jgi:hypothetical protein